MEWFVLVVLGALLLGHFWRGVKYIVLAVVGRLASRITRRDLDAPRKPALLVGPFVEK